MKRWMGAVIAAFREERDVTVEPGWGAGNLVLSRRGKMFAILSEERFVAKLPRERVDQLVARGRGTRFDPRKNGRVMKEWVVTPPGPGRTALAREAYAFVGASPTTKKVRR